MRQTSTIRLGMKILRGKFNKSIESLTILIEQEELKGKLLSKEITREAPIEPQSESNPSKAQDIENVQDINYVALGTHQDVEIIKGIRGDACVQLKNKDTSLCRFSKELRNLCYSSFSMHLKEG